MVDSMVEDSWPERRKNELKSLRAHYMADGAADLTLYLEELEATLKEMADEIVELRKKTRGLENKPGTWT